MPLDTEVGLSPGHIVLDGHPDLPTERSTAAPLLDPSLVAKLLDGSEYLLLQR